MSEEASPSKLGRVDSLTAKQPAVDLTGLAARPAAPRLYRMLMPLLLIASDFVCLAAAWGLGMVLRYAVKGPFNYLDYLRLWPYLGIWFVSFLIMGLYRGLGGGARIFITPVEELRRTTVGSTWAFLTLVTVMFVLQGGLLYSRLILPCAWLGALVLVPFGRAMVREACARQPWWGASAVVFGDGKRAQQVIRVLLEQPELGLNPVAVLADSLPPGSTVAGVPVVGEFAKASELGRYRTIPYCIVALEEHSSQRLYEIHKQYGGFFPHMMIVPDLGGLASLWIVARDVGGILGLEIRHNLLITTNRWMKRGLDLAVAIPLGLITAPFLLLAMAAIRLVSPGSAFYTQERSGRGGRVIRILKLRTMYQDAEARLQRLLASDPAAQAEWQQFFKLKRDPRILPGIGHLLRKFSLDELPQVWNVIIGEMSMVGPRPLPGYHLDSFDAEFRALRGRVMPGITGLWQVSARSDGDIEVQERLDTYYIRNWSLWMDLYLMAKTIWVVIRSRGAY